ncbi:MAG: glucosaminidase domain-containing protein [Saprospiraceae bacterium]|nr:glucosaminidase domain-containing protein [Saprospiraceae bacterium]
MRKIIVIIFIMGHFWAFADGNDPALAYIQAYRETAVSEMIRTGIPASIKLAQALLESEFGRSPLATDGNNHFGLKCGKNWKGKTYFKIDDDVDTLGQMIESCFRAFDSVEESFRCHSDFLTDENKSGRYGFLFQLSPDDYQGWAHGLRQAGYASDPQYPAKLIRLIERYQLFTIDQVLAKSDDKIEKTKGKTIPVEPRLKKEQVIAGNTYETEQPHLVAGSRLKDSPGDEKANIPKYRITMINGARAVKVIHEVTAEKLAGYLGRMPGELMAYNELIETPAHLITEGTAIFIDQKNRDFTGREDHHIVAEGETLEIIANFYGVRAQSLYALNKIPRSCRPKAGETIQLKARVTHDNKPAYVRKSEKERKYMFSALDAN